MEYEVQYILSAYVNGEEVYHGVFNDTSDLEESGLRKSEHAVAEVVDVEYGED